MESLSSLEIKEIIPENSVEIHLKSGGLVDRYLNEVWEYIPELKICGKKLENNYFILQINNTEIYRSYNRADCKKIKKIIEAFIKALDISIQK